MQKYIYVHLLNLLLSVAVLPRSLRSMSKVPVYILGSYHDDAIKLLQHRPDIDLTLNTDPSREEWLEKAVGLLIRWDTRLGGAEFSKAAKLKVVVKQGVGIDNVDLEAAKRYGIQVYNTPAINSEAVAELTLTMALCLARRVCEMDRTIHAQETIIRGPAWMAKSLFRKTIGIIGMGNIGREVAKKWQGAMDATLIAYDPFFPDDGWPDIPHTRAQSLNDLLVASDVVGIHVPLTTETIGLLGAQELAQMKDQSILLNVARGGIVEESALLDAIKAGKFWGVGLDALNVEPPTYAAYKEFLKHENVLILPHVGGDTLECQSKSGIATVDTLLAALHGGQPAGRQA